MYQVFPRKSAASGGFWFFLLLSPFFGVLLLMGMLHFGRAAIEGDLKNLALGLAMVAIFGWLAAALWRYWWQFYQIRCLEGPLFEISKTGLIDHWGSSPRRLAWSEIMSADWVNDGNGPILRFLPVERSWIERRIGSLGFRPLHYPAMYLQSPPAEIAEKICELAPERVWAAAT